jgi:hypothetical protein
MRYCRESEVSRFEFRGRGRGRQPEAEHHATIVTASLCMHCAPLAVYIQLHSLICAPLASLVVKLQDYLGVRDSLLWQTWLQNGQY